LRPIGPAKNGIHQGPLIRLSVYFPDSRTIVAAGAIVNRLPFSPVAIRSNTAAGATLLNHGHDLRPRGPSTMVVFDPLVVWNDQDSEEADDPRQQKRIEDDHKPGFFQIRLWHTLLAMSGENRSPGLSRD